jgi:hypothetical protein
MSSNGSKTIRWIVLPVMLIAALLLGIGIVSYWTIPAAPFRAEGGSLISYDPEIGFVPRPNATMGRTDTDSQGKVVVSFRLFNDSRGARVTRSGEQAPVHPDILFIGGSDTWGHGVEAEETFAYRVPLELGVTGANLSMGSYGTTQSLQMLRRNQDLAPKLIVYDLSIDHLLRNVLPCARSYYPFCLDVSHVVWDQDRRPKITPPWSDGVTRAQLQAKADIGWLDPLTWIIHGVDVAYGRILWARAKSAPVDPVMQNQAFEYLLSELAKTAESIGSSLLIVFMPEISGDSRPDAVFQLADKLRVPTLDLSPAFRTRQLNPGAPNLFMNDGHPSVAGHALIAAEISSFVRRNRLLESSLDNTRSRRSESRPATAVDPSR